MILPTAIRDWASKLLASEVKANSTSAQPEVATLHVYERLRRQLSERVGADASQALASHAFSLTKSQFPNSRMLSLLTDGSPVELGEVQASRAKSDDSEAGIVLIAHLLRLCLSLLGETATVRLIEDSPVRYDAMAPEHTTSDRLSETGTEYFENIASEAAHLRRVSERIENLIDAHDGITELLGVVGNIRNIAAALDVFTLIRSEADESNNSRPVASKNGYLN